MEEQITLDMLSVDHAWIKKEIYADYNGAKKLVDTWRRSYDNSIQGRIAVQNEVAEPYLTAIMAVWGDTPTVVEPVE